MKTPAQVLFEANGYCKTLPSGDSEELNRIVIESMTNYAKLVQEQQIINCASIAGNYVETDGGAGSSLYEQELIDETERVIKSPAVKNKPAGIVHLPEGITKNGKNYLEFGYVNGIDDHYKEDSEPQEDGNATVYQRTETGQVIGWFLKRPMDLFQSSLMSTLMWSSHLKPYNADYRINATLKRIYFPITMDFVNGQRGYVEYDQPAEQYNQFDPVPFVVWLTSPCAQQRFKNINPEGLPVIYDNGEGRKAAIVVENTLYEYLHPNALLPVCYRPDMSKPICILHEVKLLRCLHGMEY